MFQKKGVGTRRLKYRLQENPGILRSPHISVRRNGLVEGHTYVSHVRWSFPIKGAQWQTGKDVSVCGFPFKKSIIDDQIVLAASPLVTAPPSSLIRLYYNGSADKSHLTTTQYGQLRRLPEDRFYVPLGNPKVSSSSHKYYAWNSKKGDRFRLSLVRECGPCSATRVSSTKKTYSHENVIFTIFHVFFFLSMMQLS